MFICLGIFWVFLRGAPPVPSTKMAVETMVRFAQIKPGEIAADPGTGDGRIAIALVKAGAREAHGFEINPLLVLWARCNVLKAGLRGRVFIHWKDFWFQDFSKFDVVAIFGMNFIMRKIEPRLKRELKPGSRVVSNVFQFPNWPPERHENGVYLYRAPKTESDATP